MNAVQLAEKLKDIYRRQREDKYGGDIQMEHQEADELLLEYINNPTVTKQFRLLDKWYA